MPVFVGSRYQDCQYTGIVGQDLVTRRYLHARTPAKFEDVEQDWVQHELQTGEELDMLAFAYGGRNPAKANLWWLIADVNNVKFPLAIEPGTKLVVPIRELQNRGI